MATLKTNYQDDILDVSENTNRVFDLVDQNGNIIEANVSLVEKTVLSQQGDNFGANDINSTNAEVNQINEDLPNKLATTRTITGNISVANANEYYKVGKYIREHYQSEMYLNGGISFQFLPEQSPQWFSGQIFTDAPSWGPGATAWGWIMNRDTDAMYMYRAIYGSSETVIPFKGGNNMLNYGASVNISQSLPYTAPVDGVLLGDAFPSSGQDARISIAGQEVRRVVNPGDFPIYCPGIKAGNVISISYGASGISGLNLHFVPYIN